MKNATYITHVQVSMLADVLRAGIILQRDTLTDVGVLKLKKSKVRFTVYTDGATKVWEFESVHDAWCCFTERVHACPYCGGEGGIAGADGDAFDPCSWCLEFGKITEEQLSDHVEMRR